MNKIAPYWKALVAFIAPGVTLLVFAITEASAGGDKIVQSEWLGALFACLVSAAAVYRVPNKDPEGQHQDESTQPPSA